MSWNLWLAFLLASTLSALSPGPGAVLSLSVGLRHGYPAALRSIAGLQLALLLQLGVVALGVGTLLSTSVGAFAVLKLIGAAYLVWLGIQHWRATGAGAAELLSSPMEDLSRRQLLRQGVLVNLSNPKAVIFIAALVPQFIVPDRSQWLQFLIIGSTMVATDVAVMSGYALLAARLRPWLSSPRHQRLQGRVFGSFFIGTGALLAISACCAELD